MNEHLSSGLEALDRLLGGKGFKAGSTILLRGLPGTGKTTLALQITAAALRQGHKAIFLCVEGTPETSLGSITQSLWSQTHVDFLNAAGSSWVAKDLQTVWAGLPQPMPFRDPGALLRQHLWPRVLDDAPAPTFVVIDSLNALIQDVQLQLQEHNDRWMLLSVLRSLDGWRNENGGPTLLFTAEETERSGTIREESYIADAVVRLYRAEHTKQLLVSPERYDTWKEDLLYCQVIKGRGLPVQRRPCCYEFVAGQSGASDGGITFFPTYAAQGLISLFHENAPQKEVIDNLRRVDVPATYPGVMVQEYTLSGLQRLFAVRRYAEQVPARHSLIVSNVDEYWVEVLKGSKLLAEIPSDRLQLYSLPESDATGRRIVEEFRDSKEQLYRADNGSYFAVPQMLNIGMLVYREDLLERIGAKPPETWEEMEEQCQRLREQKLPHELRLETRTYDTLVVTCLELAWNHGAVWSTIKRNGKLEVQFKGDSRGRLLEALERLHRWIHALRIVPKGSTVDPAIRPDRDWAFARHWYSTWVNVLTYADVRDRRVEDRRLESREDPARYGIAKLPISKRYRDEQRARDTPPDHHSAWGEWYLGIQRGSENMDLGIELINNLMTSRKISERAISGAGLPVVEKFYEASGEDICFGTNRTFNEVREMFYRSARSRTEFADYRKVLRVLSGALRAIVNNPRSNVQEQLDLVVATLESTSRATKG